MRTKQMYVANINVVFGKDCEPLITRIEDIVIPALTSGICREATQKTKFVFKDVKLCEIEENEYVVQGIIIKDTILDVMSEFTASGELEKTNKHIPSAPYSAFLVYLRNHRMVLVKNQNGSPDMRSFTSTFREVIKTYIRNNNAQNKDNKEALLPFPSINVAGIKTSKSIKETLKDVSKINELTLKLYPLNDEWDFDPVFGGLSNEIRKMIGSKNGKVVYSSPESKNGVADLIEATGGYVKAEMKVTYNSDLSYSGTKKTGKIKDDEISEVMNVDLVSELDTAYNEIHGFKKEIPVLSKVTPNQVVDYNEFLARRKKR